MLKIFKKYKNAIVDFLYSFAAYALPTVTIQFAVYPFIDRVLGSEKNGLFLTLFNVVRLCVSVLIATLGSMRLLKKKACAEEPEKERSFNFMFVVATAVSALVTMVFNFLYQGATADAWDYILLLIVLVLLCAHDYFAIAFRVMINYRLLLADNFLIIIGYAIGCALFWMSGRWEIIFICGYMLGLGFVLLKSQFWRKGVAPAGVKQILPEYGQFCGSAGLNNATVYCDKMLIYPILGGHAVSVYNAAAIVSKVIAIISTPIGSVLLSYIVDVDKLHVRPKTLRKGITVCAVGAVGIYGCFYLASLILCQMLYPQHYNEASAYIPIILLAILIDTASGIARTIILRFAKASLQLWMSGVKVCVYLLGILTISLLGMGLWGFCLSILVANTVLLIMACCFLFRIISVEPSINKENQSET